MKKLITGVIINNIILIITSLLAFFINRYFLIYIGIESLGLINLFTQLVAYLSLIEMGLGTASAYALYKPLAKGDYNRVSQVLYTMKSIYKKIMLFVLIAGALATFLLPYFARDYTFDYRVNIYWMVFIINAVLSYLSAPYIVLYNADQKYNFVRLVEGVTKIAIMLLQMLTILIFKSLFIFIMLNSLSIVITLLAYTKYYKKNYLHLIDLSKRYEKDAQIKTDIKNLFVHKISFALGTNSDIILISMFTSLKVVGLYSSYLLVFSIWLKFLKTVSRVIDPHTGRFIALHSKDEIYRRFKKMNILYVYFSILLLTTTFLLIQPFMMFWINIKFDNNLIVTLLCVVYGIRVYRSGIEVFKLNAGYFDDIHLPILEGLINFTISLILVQRIGVAGVLLGTLIANTMISLIYKPILVYKRVFERGILDYIRDYFGYLVYLLLTLALVNLLVSGLNTKIVNFTDFIISGFKVFSLVTAMATMVFMLDYNFRSILKRVYKLAFRRTSFADGSGE